MTNDDLTAIVAKCNTALSNRPNNTKGIDEFTSADEKILSTFLTGERDNKPLYHQFKSYSTLVGNEASYRCPVKGLAQEKEDFLDLEANIKKLSSSISELNSSISGSNLAPKAREILKTKETSKVREILTGFDEIFGKTMDMKSDFYENIVAYSKEISEERKTSPQEIVRSEEGRDEIYRRIFGTEDVYLSFWLLNRNVHESFYRSVTEMLNEIDKEMEVVKDIPLVGRLAAYGLNYGLKGVKSIVPPESVMKDFYEADQNLDLESAKQIFGAQKTGYDQDRSKIIDVK